MRNKSRLLSTLASHLSLVLFFMMGTIYRSNATAGFSFGTPLVYKQR
jgi:hypothetical protein